MMFPDLLADDEGSENYEPVTLSEPKVGFVPAKKIDAADELDARFETAEFLDAIGARPEDEITQELGREAAQKAFHDMINSATANAPAGSEAAVAAFKTAVSAGNNALESVQKAVKQASDVAEANYKTMASTALNASKTAAKKR